MICEKLRAKQTPLFLTNKQTFLPMILLINEYSEASQAPALTEEIKAGCDNGSHAVYQLGPDGRFQELGLDGTFSDVRDYTEPSPEDDGEPTDPVEEDPAEHDSAKDVTEGA